MVCCIAGRVNFNLISISILVTLGARGRSTCVVWWILKAGCQYFRPVLTSIRVATRTVSYRSYVSPGLLVVIVAYTACGRIMGIVFASLNGEANMTLGTV